MSNLYERMYVSLEFSSSGCCSLELKFGNPEEYEEDPYENAKYPAWIERLPPQKPDPYEKQAHVDEKALAAFELLCSFDMSDDLQIGHNIISSALKIAFDMGRRHERRLWGKD